MALSLNDPGTDRLARAVASQLGESLTEAVRMALAQHLEPERRRRGKGDLAGRLLEIGAECAAGGQQSLKNRSYLPENGCPRSGSPARPWTLGIGCEAAGRANRRLAIRENEIDSKVLPKQTSGDFKELGVAALGHRRTILSAMGEL